MNNPLSKIRSYMLSVKTHIANGSPAPAGYCEDDRDTGYRSALRQLGIAQTSETDALANSVIYDRPLPAKKEIGQLEFGF